MDFIFWQMFRRWLTTEWTKIRYFSKSIYMNCRWVYHFAFGACTWNSSIHEKTIMLLVSISDSAEVSQHTHATDMIKIASFEWMRIKLAMWNLWIHQEREKKNVSTKYIIIMEKGSLKEYHEVERNNNAHNVDIRRIQTIILWLFFYVVLIRYYVLIWFFHFVKHV